MRSGLLTRHHPAPTTRPELVRTDVLGLIGVVPRERWPEGAVAGDVVRTPLAHLESAVLDPATRRAARAFLANGGMEGHLLAVCVPSPTALEHAPERMLRAAVDDLEGIDSVGIVAMPALGWLPAAAAHGAWDVLMRHARTMGARFVLVDPPEGMSGDGVTEWSRALATRAGPAASFGAVYHPWVQQGATVDPPSGAVAGLFARMEREHAPFGMHRPPANQPLHGVTHPARALRREELASFEASGVNPILTVPGRGVVVWGARTLSPEGPMQSVSTRRVVSAVAEQLRRDTAWATFEDAGPALWAMLARTARARLDQLVSSGVIEPPSGSPDCVVECNAELNPPSAAGVRVRVAFRPAGAVEHIVLQVEA